MNWEQLISPVRLGLEGHHDRYRDNRNQFQRDYDRLIFSAPFRRLQNKTQVFPLPGSVFVHNRLTHSLEVASVGRSLGNNLSEALVKRGNISSPYLLEIGSIVAAACLAHDMGNPPFGHSGEEAIGTYFSEGKGKWLQEELTVGEWADLMMFEGNANAFRLLTHQFNGRRSGGFVLTYSTLASIVKYPYASNHRVCNKRKFGFFQSEKMTYEKVANRLGITHRPNSVVHYSRFPLVYLVEAADDICYQIMDIEDAHKLKILSTEETKELMFGFFDKKRQARLQETMSMVTDTNEQIAYLRSSVIGVLIDGCTVAFLENEEAILAGSFDGTLIQSMSVHLVDAYKKCSNIAIKKIYKSSEVLDVELAGYKIIYTLIEHFMEAVFQPDNAYSKQLLARIPEQYHIDSPTIYGKIQSVLDFVSGMTDVYALELYRKIMGLKLA